MCESSWQEAKKRAHTNQRSFESLNSIIGKWIACSRSCRRRRRCHGLVVFHFKNKYVFYVLFAYTPIGVCPLNFPIEMRFVRARTGSENSSMPNAQCECDSNESCKCVSSHHHHHHYAWQWLFCVWMSSSMFPFPSFSVPLLLLPLLAICMFEFVCNCFFRFVSQKKLWINCWHLINEARYSIGSCYASFHALRTYNYECMH